MEAFFGSLLTVDGLSAIVEILLVIIGSFLADWIPGFTELSRRAKRLYWLAVPMILALGAMYVLALIREVPITAENVFLAISVGGLAFYGSQLAETRDLSGAKKTTDTDAATSANA